MLMQIDGTFLFVAISFLVFLAIIKHILFNPITRVMDERENFYQKNSKMEFETREKVKALLEQKELALKETRKEAADLTKQAVQKAKNSSALKIKQARNEVQALIEQNRQQLNQETSLAKTEIKKEVNTIVESIVSKILNQEISINIDENKIEEYLKI